MQGAGIKGSLEARVGTQLYILALVPWVVPTPWLGVSGYTVRDLKDNGAVGVFEGVLLLLRHCFICTRAVKCCARQRT